MFTIKNLCRFLLFILGTSSAFTHASVTKIYQAEGRYLCGEFEAGSEKPTKIVPIEKCGGSNFLYYKDLKDKVCGQFTAIGEKFMANVPNRFCDADSGQESSYGHVAKIYRGSNNNILCGKFNKLTGEMVSSSIYIDYCGESYYKMYKSKVSGTFYCGQFTKIGDELYQTVSSTSLCNEESDKEDDEVRNRSRRRSNSRNRGQSRSGSPYYDGRESIPSGNYTNGSVGCESGSANCSPDILGSTFCYCN